MTSIQVLPPELISLVHHIELNKAGWWDKAIEQLLVTTIWVAGKSLSASDVSADLKKSFQVDLDDNKIRDHLNRLCSKGVLVCMPTNEFKISEVFLTKYEDGMREAEELEKSVKDLFVMLIKEHCPTLDTKVAWESFNEKFLSPFIRETGANTYKLLSEGNINLSPARFERFLTNYPPELHLAFSNAVEDFLNPKNLHVRSYILRSLNAYFFIEAGSLRDDTLQALIKFTGSNPVFNIFVDTNFLFSILGLIHSSDDAGQSLTTLTKRLSGKVTVKLYALPTTLDEAKRKLISTKQSLNGIRVLPNLAEAASHMNLDGLQIKFFEESRKRGILSAEDYFEPYISDLTSIMRTKGIELYNEDVDPYKIRQDVIDDILSQQKLNQTI